MSKVTSLSFSNSRFPTGELYAVNIDGKKEIILTGRQAKRSTDTVKDDPKKPATLIDILPDEPDKIIVQFFSSDEFWRLYKVDIFDGEMERYAVPPVKQPYYQFDANGQLIAVRGVNKDTFDLEIYLYNKNIPTDTFVGSYCGDSEIDCIEAIGKKNGGRTKNPDWTFWKESSWDSRLQLISFNKENNTLITIENQGNDLSGIYETNLSSGKRKLIYRHKTVDVRSALTDDDGNLYGATFMDGYPSLVFFKGESAQKERLKYIKSLFPNSLISPSNISDDETRQTFMVSSDTNPGIFYFVDSKSEQITPLAKFWSSIDYSNLAPMEPISFMSRDGSMIHGYLTKSKKR
jgi:dipeptidyl aminopeptidase/acylaminoacyl peptidase